MKISGYVIIVMMLLAPNLKAADSGHSQWLERQEILKQDKSVVRHYTFENVENSKSVAKDLAGSGADLTFVPFPSGKEKIGDLKVIEGRWPGKPAVRLDRGWYQGAPTDVENNRFTVEVWLYVRQHRREQPAPSWQRPTARRKDGGWSRYTTSDIPLNSLWEANRRELRGHIHTFPYLTAYGSISPRPGTAAR